MAGPGRLKPQLLLLIGLPGAGKSTLARALAPQLGAVIVDRDAIRAALFPNRTVDAAISAAANAQMEQTLRRQLCAGHSAIADGRSFASAPERARLARLAADCGADCVQIWVDVPVALAIARVEATRAAHPASDRDAALVRAVAARFEPPAQALRLDGRLPAAALADAALRALAAQSGSSAPLE